MCLWWSWASRLSPPHEWHTCSIVRPLCIITHSHTNRAAKVALSPVNYLGWVITCLFGIVLWSPVRPAPVQNVLLHLHLLSGLHSSVSKHLLFTTRLFLITFDFISPSAQWRGYLPHSLPHCSDYRGTGEWWRCVARSARHSLSVYVVTLCVIVINDLCFGYTRLDQMR